MELDEKKMATKGWTQTVLETLQTFETQTLKKSATMKEEKGSKYHLTVVHTIIQNLVNSLCNRY